MVELSSVPFRLHTPDKIVEAPGGRGDLYVDPPVPVGLKDRYFIAIKGRIENGGVGACPQGCVIRIPTLRVKFCRAFWLVLRVILQKVVLQHESLLSN